MSLKIAISGQPGTGKTQIFSKLKSNPWFVSKKTAFEKNEIAGYLDHEQVVKSQYHLIDVYIEKLLQNLNSNVSVYDKSVLDTLPVSMSSGLKGQAPSSLVNTVLIKVSSYLKYYDKIYVILDEEKPYYNEYQKIQRLFAGKKNIEFLEGMSEKTIYNKIILDSEDYLKRKRIQNNEDSNQWFTTFGQDYINTSPQES